MDGLFTFTEWLRKRVIRYNGVTVITEDIEGFTEVGSFFQQNIGHNFKEFQECAKRWAASYGDKKQN